MFKITNNKKGENSTIELTVIVPEEDVLKHRAHALKHLGEHAEMPGFRKGHIPDNILVSKFGEQAVLEEAAEHAIEEHYADIVMELKVRPISHPKIVITKIAKGNDLEFSLVIEVMPEISLPDYKKIAKKAGGKKESVEVTDKEVDDVISQFTKHHAKAKASPDTDARPAGSETQLREGEEAPPLTDDFVKTLGDFKDVADLKTKIKDNLLKEKESQAIAKRRSDIISAITTETSISIPLSLIERELDQMTNEFSYELSRMGQTFDAYKTHTKKTEEEIRTEWKDKARTRVAQELVLQQIAEAEKIEANKDEVQKEVEHMLKVYPDTPKERIVSFVEDVQMKQQVFKFLEELGN